MDLYDLFGMQNWRISLEACFSELCVSLSAVGKKKTLHCKDMNVVILGDLDSV